ncbi:MAG: hypothetical protein ABEJ56_01670 [Candidatus Nanohaloarchaea archaeon]
MSTIDANTRNFETELQAQEETGVRMETQLHQEATVLTATAL